MSRKAMNVLLESGFPKNTELRYLGIMDYRMKPIFNGLATTHPELALEWSEQNGDLHPDMVNDKSTNSVWWKETSKWRR